MTISFQPVSIDIYIYISSISLKPLKMLVTEFESMKSIVSGVFQTAIE